MKKKCGYRFLGTIFWCAEFAAQQHWVVTFSAGLSLSAGFAGGVRLYFVAEGAGGVSSPHFIRCGCRPITLD